MNEQHFEDDVRKALRHLAEAQPVENGWDDIGARLPVEPVRAKPTGALWGAVAAAAIALVGWVSFGNDSLTVEAVDDTTSVAEEASFAGFAACRAFLEEFVANTPASDEVRPLLNDPDVEVRRFEHPDRTTTRVAFISGEQVATCDVRPDANETANILGTSLGRVRQDPVNPRAIKVAVESTSSSSPDGNVGPGTTTVIGRVGSDVEAVLLELADGSVATAVIDRGWFSILAAVPAGVPMGPGHQEVRLEFAPEVSEPEVSEPPTTEDAPPSQTRWFLAPPDGDLRAIDGRNHFWSAAQNQIDERNVVVTTDLDNQAAAGVAWIYHLDHVGIEITNGPEEFDETFRDVEVDGRIVRVGSNPETGSVKAFTDWDPGVVAMIGYGVSEDDAIAAVLATEVVNGVVVVGASGLDDLAVAEHPSPEATDHSTQLDWTSAGVDATLSMTPGSLASARLNAGSGSIGSPTTVRGVPAVFFADIPNQNPATLAWAEDGYAFALTVGSDGDEQGLDVLAALAETLVVVDQPALVERFGDAFMARQPEAVAAWLEDARLPPGWDPDNFIHGVPGGEFETASFIRQFLACAWGAEWLDAFDAGDDQRRAVAYQALERQSDWSIVDAQIAAFEVLVENSELYGEQLTASLAVDLAVLDSIEQNPDGPLPSSNLLCGFEVPENGG